MQGTIICIFNFFLKFVLRKIAKIVAARCQIFKLKGIKIDFGWGSTPDPTEGAYSAQHTP